MASLTDDLPNVWDIASEILFPASDTWVPQPHQIPPPGQWFVWMLLGGRGAGKTATSARHLHEHVHGPPCLPDVPGGHWPAIIGPTLGDAVTSCVLGPSGLRAHDPGVKVKQAAGGTMARWTNGVEAKLFGAHTPEDVERLRSGGNRCIVWAEELAAWRYMQECWEHMRYGLRVGPWPHVIVSTTPKNRKLIKELVKKADDEIIVPETGDREVVITKATTKDNPHLDERVKRMLFEDYGGTRLGRQELYADILDDNINALWTETMLERARMLDAKLYPEQYDRKVVGVDPAMTEEGDEHGIVVCGMTNKFRQRHDVPFANLPHGYVIEDVSLHGNPETWAKTAIKAYHEFECNLIVAEKNNGGDLVKANIHAVDSTIPVKLTWASRGKAKRAEPISTLTEQGRIHLMGHFPELEEQMCEFDPIEPDDSWSPDRMDAMVWGLWHLLVESRLAAWEQVKDTRLRGRR